MGCGLPRHSATPYPPMPARVAYTHKQLAEELSEAVATLHAYTKALDGIYAIQMTAVTPESEAAGVRLAFRNVNVARETKRLEVVELRERHDAAVSDGQCPSDCVARRRSW